MTHVRDIDAEAFGLEVLQASHRVPVVVDFWAPWCGPCRTLSPILERLAAEYQGAFELVKVNVDENQALAAQFGVQGIPYVLAFRNGEPVNSFTGALPEAQVRAWLDQLAPSQADLAVEEARDAMLAGDEERAEILLRRVLEAEPDHVDAATGLAALLIARSRTEEALEVLAPLPATAEVDRLRAAARVAASQDSNVAELEARLTADPDDAGTRLELAQALAAGSEFEPALDHMLTVVRSGGPRRDDARRAMLDVFEVLGVDHPLTVDYRRRLASALY